MANVAQKLEQLDYVMGSVQEDGAEGPRWRQGCGKFINLELKGHLAINEGKMQRIRRQRGLQRQ
ncbi:Transcriptional factor DELLA, N-terminal [Sesbania bispinosa]|nr:Transcriptional factor DELLA, N-terminal [Sesbania bispinosa]